MLSRTPEEIVGAWEACVSAHPVDRPLALLRTLGRHRGVDGLDALPIGKRDALVLELRAETLGPMLDVFVECPRCREPLEFAIDSRGLVEPEADVQRRVVPIEGGEIELRPLDTRDLIASASCGDVDAASATLVARGIVSVRRDGREAEAATLSDDERKLVAHLLAELDAAADIAFELTCPACAHAWTSSFDPTSFFIAELSTIARRLLRQVTILARAFGWTERDVFALGPARRQFYLELAHAQLGVS